jgi:hypothetical protein
MPSLRFEYVVEIFVRKQETGTIHRLIWRRLGATSGLSHGIDSAWTDAGVLIAEMKDTFHCCSPFNDREI